MLTPDAKFLSSLSAVPILLTVALLAASCSKPPTSGGPVVLARVGSEVLTEEAFRVEAARRGVSNDATGKQALLEEMVRDLRLLHHARSRGYQHHPEVVRATRAVLLDRARADFSRTDENDPQPVTDSEVQNFYEKNRSDFHVPARLRAAMIFIAKGSGSDDSAGKRKAETARAAVLGANLSPGAHFGALAADFSEDQATRYRGGDLGYQVAGMTSAPADLEAQSALFAMKQPGEVSEIVAATSGFYIFKLIERSEEGELPVRRVADRIRARIQAARAEERNRAAESAIATIPAETHPDMLESIVLPAPDVDRQSHSAPPALPLSANTP